MIDSLGWRKKFAIVAPSTNTSVQPEFDEMRARGVTNHFSRVWIPDDPVESDEDFNKLMDNIRAELDNAVKRVLTCRPDYLVMGMSSETFWGGLQTSIELKNRMEDLSGLRVTMGSDACRAALSCYGEIKRIAVLTPYWPVGDKNVRIFFSDCGFEVVRMKGLKCNGPVEIAYASPTVLVSAMKELDGTDIDAIVQVGTNLAMARLAGIAEIFFNKPVLAINTATYWYALRDSGIDDPIDGFGSLLAEHREIPSTFLNTGDQ
ncbi:MAG: arylmalonate decarboxylase [Rhodospirillaceae bacterium]|nr:arylmalonate decarboxylase [Rhodospirillaceae bacterium]